MPAEDSVLLTLPRVFLFLTPLPTGPCRAAPTVCTMILKGGGAGRGWSQVSWTSKSPLGSRKSRYVQFECVCAAVWESVSQCERGCPTVGRYFPLWEGVWDGVSHCGKVCGMVCPIVGRCVGCVCVCACVCVCPCHVCSR